VFLLRWVFQSNCCPARDHRRWDAMRKREVAIRLDDGLARHFKKYLSTLMEDFYSQNEQFYRILCSAQW